MITVADYPQLQLIAWSRQPGAVLEEREALALYEANWRFIEPDQLTEQERILIDFLRNTYGNGVLNV